MIATEWIQAISTSIACLASAVLARITYIYVRETKRIAAASEKQTELSLRPFVMLTSCQDAAGSWMFYYRNIGHSAAIAVQIERCDAGSVFLDFNSHVLIDAGEAKELIPKGRGKDQISDGFVQAVETPSITPEALAERDFNLILRLIIHYQNLERVSYITKVNVDRTGIEFVSTERA